MSSAVCAGQQDSKTNTNSCPLDQQQNYYILKKLLKSTPLIKAGKLVKLAEVGRLCTAVH